MTVVIIGLRPTIETAKLHEFSKKKTLIEKKKKNEFSEKHTGMLQILK